jgi:hypothetical protein
MLKRSSAKMSEKKDRRSPRGEWRTRTRGSGRQVGQHFMLRATSAYLPRSQLEVISPPVNVPRPSEDTEEEIEQVRKDLRYAAEMEDEERLKELSERLRELEAREEALERIKRSRKGIRARIERAYADHLLSEEGGTTEP